MIMPIKALKTAAGYVVMSSRYLMRQVLLLQALAFSASSENEDNQLALQKEVSLRPHIEEGREEAPILRFYVAGKHKIFWERPLFLF